jgi:tRNA-specific 2-thiouridylase
MATKKTKVVVAMSGGVDSSVTAALLLEQGYEVSGVSLRLWEYKTDDPKNCSDYSGARAVADLIGIPHTLLDARAEFREEVAETFARAYLQGRTPNPCVACNRDFKLGRLMSWARERGADYLATGHYARVARDPSGRAGLMRGHDPKKDQSYFLFSLSQEQLAFTLFPLGELHKSEVRARARQLGLPVAGRPDSQDICFGDYRALVESFARKEEVGGGEIVDRSGAVLGEHRGIHRLTVGQRKGLGLSAAEPLYVLEIDAASRKVVVGKKAELACKGLAAGSVNWIEPPAEDEISAEVQVRYRTPAVPCVLRRDGDERLNVFFREASPSVTPGQAAVFYQGERVLGGGWIERAITKRED